MIIANSQWYHLDKILNAVFKTEEIMIKHTTRQIFSSIPISTDILIQPL